MQILRLGTSVETVFAVDSSRVTSTSNSDDAEELDMLLGGSRIPTCRRELADSEFLTRGAKTGDGFGPLPWQIYASQVAAKVSFKFSPMSETRT